jgi:SAM-dependent methyltransferase
VFLRNGNPVIGIEPNAAMREAAAEYLRRWPLFRGVDACAEATSLSDAGIDFIVVGQALHWLDHAQSRREFERVLRRDGWVVLVWNSRISSGHSFSGAYHQLLCRYCGENAASPRRTSDRQIDDFFSPHSFRRVVFPNVQKLDWDGIKGRLLSSSYVPAAGQPLHDEIIAGLYSIYRQHESDNAVELNYNTEVFYGQFH